MIILASEKQYFFILGAIFIYFYASVSNLNNKTTNEGSKIFLQINGKQSGEDVCSLTVASATKMMGKTSNSLQI